MELNVELFVNSHEIGQVAAVRAPRHSANRLNKQLGRFSNLL